MYIRKSVPADASRIAEILVFNNRVNYLPIFRDENYSFGDLQVMTLANKFLADDTLRDATYVYDDGLVRGFVHVVNEEVVKLYVDTFFQGRGIGAELIEFAKREKGARFLWVLDKNLRARAFYERHGFRETGETDLEEDTTEILRKVELADQ